MAWDWSSDQPREPRRHTVVPCGVGGANWETWRERRAGSVLYDDPHVAHEPQLRAEIGEEFFRRHLLLHEGNRLSHEQLGQSHRCGDFDPRGRARLEDRYGAR